MRLADTSSYLVAAGARADGCTIADLAVGEDVWISVVIRDGHLVPVHGSTRLQAGDEVLALTDAEHTQNLTLVFATEPNPPGTGFCAGLLSWPRAIEMERTRS
jgi:Trk K+ transport system NAD-binding subunit